MHAVAERDVPQHIRGNNDQHQSSGFADTITTFQIRVRGRGNRRGWHRGAETSVFMQSSNSKSSNSAVARLANWRANPRLKVLESSGVPEQTFDAIVRFG